MDFRLLTVELKFEHDLVLARQRTRQIAALLGFELQEQTRIATSASEICRNAFKYAGGGRVELSLRTDLVDSFFLIRVDDQGPGIADVDAILGGLYRSDTGMGLGMLGSKRLMDVFDVRPRLGGGTSVLLGKRFGRGMAAPTAATVAQLTHDLARTETRSPVEEIQRQNQELVGALEEVRASRAELLHVNRELEDTNRGVVALLAELDEKADLLKHSSEMKTRFLSNVSHELRTPLNTILSFTQLLLSRYDGPLTEEQERQVGFIRKAAQDLSELVNDVLDLAKVEAGKIVVRPAPFDVGSIFGALRGMLRPLLVSNVVQLVFEDPPEPIVMNSDESKVSQILRNFISNGLKFTQHGEVRVSARVAGDTVIFSVKDTGIGIAPEDQDRIFEEFIQIESPLQQNLKGTGLGLSLSRTLATLLGGRLRVESAPGLGSNFVAELPLQFQGAAEASIAAKPLNALDPLRLPVLVIEDDIETVAVYEKYFTGSGYQAVSARTLAEAKHLVAALRPAAIILDILLGNESTWSFLAALKSQPATQSIPVIVATVVDSERKAKAIGAEEYAVKPVDPGWLLGVLDRHLAPQGRERILLIDDDEAARYYMRGLLSGSRYDVSEASGGIEGLRTAREERPDTIILDLRMPDLNGHQVLAQLKADKATAGIPVIIMTGGQLEDSERRQLHEQAIAILSKDVPSREVALRRLRDALARADAFRRARQIGATT